MRWGVGQGLGREGSERIQGIMSLGKNPIRPSLGAQLESNFGIEVRAER
jgi:hypothetical protein